MQFIKPTNNNVNDILARSTKATCGITEREVMVAKHKVPTTIKKLDRAGFHVIGTSYRDAPRKKIWFIRRGGL